jgi:hypothetical protein
MSSSPAKLVALKQRAFQGLRPRRHTILAYILFLLPACCHTAVVAPKTVPRIRTEPDFPVRIPSPDMPFSSFRERVSIPAPLGHLSAEDAASTGSYLRVLEEKFPGAMPEKAFIRQATEVLLDHGFNPSNSINLVSTCRDEICRPFSQELDRLWGPSFSISSLGGMVFCGRSGFKAAMAHSPVRSGRERYIFWVMPHIALSRSSMLFP